MKSVTVFCGTGIGNDPRFEAQAYLLGKTLALEDITLVYGGAQIGLMGAAASGALDHQGRVTGIIPAFLLEAEIAHPGLSELIVVETMHQRKMKMNELSEGVITLPGGFGTMEEFFEMLTWAQLGLHRKPIGILNINGFYDELLIMIRTMVQKGFLKEIYLELLLVSDSIPDLLDMMAHYQPPALGKRITPDKV